MAKMFYTLDEAKAALNKSEEEIKQLSREGRLREFRDGQRLMFKADQVETLKSELESGGASLDHVDLGTSDSGMAIGLVDSKGASKAGGSVAGLTLEDTEPGHRSGAGMVLKEDTALSADLGLSGSVGGVPSPSRLSGSNVPTGTGASALSGSQAGRGGIDIFQSDDIERVDPSAQTAVSGGGVVDHDNLNTESIGSGSGLLDLTRESDDTSLGAELLDEIAPGASKMGGTGVRKAASDSNTGATGTVAGGVVDSRNIGPGIGRGGPVSTITEIERPDSLAVAFGAAALGAAAVVMFGIFALITGVLNTQPPVMKQLSTYPLPYIAGAGLGVALLFFLVGLVIGKVTTK